MIEKGFQHGDISIGNVLSLPKGRNTRPVMETLNECPSPSPHRYELALLVQECQMSPLCRGFMIDGEMAIELEPYLNDKKRRDSLSVNKISFLPG